jgi:hypothetical protein
MTGWCSRRDHRRSLRLEHRNAKKRRRRTVSGSDARENYSIRQTIMRGITRWNQYGLDYVERKNPRIYGSVLAYVPAERRNTRRVIHELIKEHIMRDTEFFEQISQIPRESGPPVLLALFCLRCIIGHCRVYSAVSTSSRRRHRRAWRPLRSIPMARIHGDFRLRVSRYRHWPLPTRY